MGKAEHAIWQHAIGWILPCNILDIRHLGGLEADAVWDMIRVGHCEPDHMQDIGLDGEEFHFRRKHLHPA